MGLFDRKPRLDTCVICSELIAQDQLREHYEEHVIPVTDENGDRAYTFECPRCGKCPRAFGARKPDHIAREDAARMLAAHVSMGHNKMGLQWR